MITTMPMLLRRELWEHRALYAAPFVLAALVVFGFVLSFFTLIFTGSSVNAAVSALELTGAPGGLAGGAALVGVPFLFMYFVLVGVVFFYSVSALSEERKDRSILFWRSLPVTDTETVLSKFLTAILVAPVITIVMVVITHVILLVLASVAIMIGGGNPVELLLGPLPFVQIWVLLAYMLVTASLWFAPVVAWFLICSSFAKNRSVFVWVFVPWLVLIMLEGIVFRKPFVAPMIARRFSDGVPAAFDAPAVGVLPDNIDEEVFFEMLKANDLNILELIAPGKFLMTPGLWTGLIVAAIFLAGAIYFRRLRA
ncbi:MAG: hypothetical protein AAAFM81_10185 [Pseudomonadota bacterium]